MKYTYLYQDRENANHTGEIVARDRADAYARLRKQGIRPYRVIGDDPWNWRPLAISAGYVILAIALVVVGVIALSQRRQLRELQLSELAAREQAALQSEAAQSDSPAANAFQSDAFKETKTDEN